MALDAMNRKILELLLADGRRTGMEIARILDRAESTVRERIRAMERTGVIRGYRVLLDEEKVGLGGKAIVRARVDLARVPQVCERLGALPNVTQIWQTSGEWPITFVVVAPTLREVQGFLAEQGQALGLLEVKADVVLHTPPSPPGKIPWPTEAAAPEPDALGALRRA